MKYPIVVEDYDSAQRRGLTHDEALEDVARRRAVDETWLERVVEMREVARQAEALGADLWPDFVAGRER